MESFTRADLVLVHLLESERTHAVADHRGPTDPLPRAFSLPGIGEVLDLGPETVSERIKLLAALSALTNGGYVAEASQEVVGLDGEQTVYTLTDAGRDRARRIADAAGAETVVVESTAGRKEHNVSSMGEVFDASPIARTLAQRTDAGVVYLTPDEREQFVDREDAMATVRDLLDRSVEGSRGIVVTGTVGIGKTDVLERVTTMASEAEFETLVGRGRRHGVPPFAALVEALDGFPGPGPASLLVADGGQAAASGAGGSQRDELFDEVAGHLADLADGSPVLLAIDDVHWTDEPTLTLLDHLRTTLADSPVVFAVTSPPIEVVDDAFADRLGQWIDDCGWAHVDLAPLSVSDVRRVVEWLTDRSDVPGAYVEYVHERTGGNPLLVKATVNQSLEEGTIVPDAGYFPVPDDDDRGLPDRIRDVVEQQLRTLDPQVRTILELASIAGETVTTDVLAALSDRSPRRCRDYVSVLVDAGILAWTDESTVRFQSAVTRDALYEGIDDERRRHLHCTLADVIESEDDVEYTAAAHHRHRAGDVDRAFEHYRSAAERAEKVFAYEAVIDLRETALELAREHGGREVDVVEQAEEIGRMYYLLGDFDDANRYFQFVHERTDDPRIEGRLYRRQCHIFWTRDLDRALDFAAKGIAAFDRIDDPDEDTRTNHAKLLGDKAIMLAKRGGDEEPIRALLDRRVALVRSIDKPDILAYAYQDRGLTKFLLDDFFGAIDDVEAAIDHLEGTGRTDILSKLYDNLGMIYSEYGRPSAGLPYLERALESQSEVGNRHAKARILDNLGAAHCRLCNWREMREALAWSDRLSQDVGDVENIAAVLINFGAGALVRGSLDEAEAHLDEVDRMADDLNDASITRSIRGYQGELAYYRGDLALAAETIEGAIAETAGYDGLVPVTYFSLVSGRIDRARGDFEAAIEHHEAALALAVGRNDPTNEAIARGELAVDHARVGAGDEAVAAATAAFDRGPHDDQPNVAARLRYALGVAHHAAGEDPIDDLESALETAESAGTRLLTCRIRLELATVLRDRGESDAARENLARAREIVAESGAGLFEDRCRDLQVSFPDRSLET